MATVKSHTDLEQSKKLAEILPLESADMFLAMNGTLPVMSKYIDSGFVTADESAIPCWSLAALLDVLPSATLDSSGDHYYRLHCMERFTEWYDNPVDACVAMIEKLHKLNLL